MIGLEFICKVYDIQYKEVAGKIGVSNQTITDWIKGKTARIPSKRLDDLVTKVPEFMDFPKELFSKELTPKDKQKITTTFLIEDVKKQLREARDKRNVEGLQKTIELTEFVKEGIVSSSNIDSLLLIAEHLLGNKDFMRDLDKLILEYDPSLEKHLR
jgi:transcriptional regulator with XRE-family HTH domain